LILDLIQSRRGVFGKKILQYGSYQEREESSLEGKRIILTKEFFLNLNKRKIFQRNFDAKISEIKYS